MHAFKDSMWRGMWKILQIFLRTKQGRCDVCFVCPCVLYVYALARSDHTIDPHYLLAACSVLPLVQARASYATIYGHASCTLRRLKKIIRRMRYKSCPLLLYRNITINLIATTAQKKKGHFVSYVLLLLLVVVSTTPHLSPHTRTTVIV